MTDLADFGAGVHQPDEGGDESESTGSGYGHGFEYRDGRCRAIKRDGRRCRSPAPDDDLCHTHKMERDPVTIDDGPVRLIEATTRTLWENFDHDIVREAVLIEEGQR